MMRAPIDSQVGFLVGIDLGTTNSLVAVLQDGRPVLIPNAVGEHLTPSAVSVDGDGRVMVGPDARARLSFHGDATAVAFKRDMGTDRSYRLAGRAFRPEELSAAVLASLKADAEAFLGQPVREAVVTVPAYFGDLQREATKAAARIAGLSVERIINEPTAAALAYGLHNLDRELKAVVLDLGGGTFDVTLLEIIEGVIEIQSSAGDARLGGEDFAASVRELLEQALLRRHGLDAAALTPASRGRLHEAAEAAKVRLSQVERTAVMLPALSSADGQQRDVELELTRQEVEAAWQPLLQRLRRPIERALRDAGQDPRAIDEVLLVGGATRTPCVRALAAELFGRAPRGDLPPDEAVAMGAAVQAALKAGDASVEELVVTDVAPFTLGIATATRVGTRMVEGVFSPILERGTVIPASRVERFQTMADRQSKIEVEVYQGEHAGCADNTLLGRYTVKGIPAAPAGEQSIDVRFTYDLNGVLEVEVTVVETGAVRQVVIERNPGALTPAQVARARAEMQKLKFHPRETLPNRTALARADALFVELTGEPRALLGQAIADFRATLETQDPAAIARERESLTRLTAELKQRAP